MRCFGELVERRPSLGKQCRAGLGRHGIAAGAPEQRSAEPILERADLPAHRAMRHMQLLGGARKATEPRGGLEGFDRIEWWQSRSHEDVSFPHIRGQNKSLVTKSSWSQMVAGKKRGDIEAS